MAMTARRSFDVAGKIAFVLWRHGQRRNGTMPTIRAALLCTFTGSAWIPRARSPSRIERSRTRLPVGLRSLMCENRLEVTQDNEWLLPCVNQLLKSVQSWIIIPTIITTCIKRPYISLPMKTLNASSHDLFVAERQLRIFQLFIWQHINVHILPRVHIPWEQDWHTVFRSNLFSMLMAFYHLGTFTLALSYIGSEWSRDGTWTCWSLSSASITRDLDSPSKNDVMPFLSLSLAAVVFSVWNMMCLWNMNAPGGNKVQMSYF